MDVKGAITVNRPSDELYQFWHNFENLPRFMEHLKSVQVTGEKRSHWTAKGPAGTTVEWDAEVVDDQPGAVIAWRSLDGAAVDNAGSVRHFKQVMETGELTVSDATAKGGGAAQPPAETA